MAVSLRHFVPVDPSVLLSPSSPWFGWIKLIIYCTLFITIVHAFFPRHLKDHPGRRSVAVVLGLMLGIGLFLAEKTFHFSFESFAFLSIWILIFIIGIVTFGVFRMGLRPDIAFATTYVLIYLSFLAISPSLFDAIGDFFELLNIVLFVCFIYLIGLVLLKVFKRKDGLTKAEGLIGSHDIAPADEDIIREEIKKDDQENDQLKHNLLRITDHELSSAEDMLKAIDQLSAYLQQHTTLTDDDKRAIAQVLERLAMKKSEFLHGLALFRQHIVKHKNGDENKLRELLVRMKQTKDEKKRSEIRQEWIYEKKKIDIYSFMQENEPRLQAILQTFENRMYHATEQLRTNEIQSALQTLSMAKSELEPLKNTFRKFKTYEKYLIEFNKKEEGLMNKELKGK